MYGWQVDGKIVSEIGQGLLVLVGLLESDTDVDSEFMFVSYSDHFFHVHSGYNWGMFCYACLDGFLWQTLLLLTGSNMQLLCG